MIIINFTPTGIIPTKEQTPYVPISVNEIADDVFAACELGITTLHLHARNDDGSPSYSVERYAQIIEKSANMKRIWLFVYLLQEGMLQNLRKEQALCT